MLKNQNEKLVEDLRNSKLNYQSLKIGKFLESDGKQYVKKRIDKMIQDLDFCISNLSSKMKQKIKLNIGNRIYPLSVNIEQEEVLRKAAKEINEMIIKYEKSYAVKDKQDSLAMCALEIFTNNKKITMDQSKLGTNTEEKLKELIELIDKNIN